ncbi:protein spindle-F [Adelges cooleyi]|uniref:protein spindle-F n=1 Tax=Adelges cooleyi TaxID=133065 RepID=UPI00217F50EB|nr:protein spindle-F [Adelges cooleyi]
MSVKNTLGNLVDDLESTSALRIALQTLAERCEKLQTRLDVVEKENVAIRSRCNCQATGSQLKKSDIEELSCKKEQLVEYLRIVTAENRKLWSKLSSIENHTKHSNDLIKPKNSLALIDNYLKYNDDNIKMDPKCIVDAEGDFLSTQYSSDDETWPMLLSELNAFKEKLTLAKHLIADQNNSIINITSKYNLLVEEVKVIKPTAEYRDAETLTTSTLDLCPPCVCGIHSKPQNQCICPLCKLYIVGAEGDKIFDKLVEHVSSHFPEEETETIIDSLSGHY